jgi:hypothetical protein
LRMAGKDAATLFLNHGCQVLARHHSAHHAA